MKSCSVSDGLAIFKALGSPVRVQILRLIQEREGLNTKPENSRYNPVPSP